ncbi:DUF4389 domain-containing protein [Saccharopolyspora erythraea]|uniref:DUF4389 domain-containing protein n=1 Tax=Saccharopolyspora erythraea TaxID=1836 RepID=UPI001BA8418D|nr:DUF4389 domain-containing protein [Saccharopolyspora erythraea]QUH01356.1 DUF4389 domain-containing protein [Saccharopolyspora erythraea]
MSEPGGQPGESRPPFLPEVQIEGPGPQRRWTVLVRLILLIPHFIVLYAVGIAAAVVAVLGWFAALFTARLPTWIADFLVLYVGYRTRVGAYLTLLVDSYPQFLTTSIGYPVRVDIRPGRLNRAAVFFRLILVIPAAVVAAVLAHGWTVLAFFLWLAVLITGRTPQPVFGASAAFVRYELRVQSYWYLLTDSYPKRLFGDGGSAAEGARAQGTRPLTLSTGARVLLIAFIVLGVLGLLATGLSSALHEPAPEYYQYYEYEIAPSV